MNKGFWMEKSSSHVNDGDANLSNTASIGPKRPYLWYVDDPDEIYPNKKQELLSVNSKQSSELLYANTNPWDHSSGLQSVPNQFMDRLFGDETVSSEKFTERNLCSLGIDDLNRRKETDEQFRDDVPIGLSMSHHDVGNPQTCLGYTGSRKVKVSQVKDCVYDINAPSEHGSGTNNMSNVQSFNRETETSYVTIGQAYEKDHNSMTLMGNVYDTTPNYARGDDSTVSVVDNFVKSDTNMMSFGGFPDDQDIIPVGRPLGSYDQFYQPASVISDPAGEKELNVLNTSTILNSSQGVKPRTDSVSKNKTECKTTRKEAPNSFPSNVRSLISTGMLDGVPVKYVSLAREVKELRGIIKGSGYLCGCQTCNYAKVLNAYEFERHAGCKTKHPNNHIYFENGKTIYQIVQELRNTPESLLFDTIQTVFGAPINQKSFRIWKESFQAATRELQRIYGKEELNL